MFASLAPAAVETKPKKLRIASLGLAAGCSLAGLLYWFAYSPSTEHQRPAKDGIAKQEKTEPMHKAPLGPGISKSSHVRNGQEQKNNKLSRTEDAAQGSSIEIKNQKKQVTLKVHREKTSPSRNTKQDSLPIPEIEIELEPQEKAPKEKTPQEKKLAQVYKDTLTREEEKTTEDSLSTPPEKPQLLATEDQAGQANADSAASKTATEKMQETPPKPSYQAPEVVAKRRIAGSDPDYPPMARKAKLRATVLVKIHISPNGKVGFMKILKGNPLFNDAVTKAIKTWRFSPYTINGRPVGTYTVYKFVFQID